MHSPFDPGSSRFFSLHPSLPENFNGYILRGAIARSLRSPAGSCIIQSYNRPEFSIQFGIFRLLSVIRMTLGYPGSGAGSLLAMRGDMFLQATRDRQTLRAGQFSFLAPGEETVNLGFGYGEDQQFFEVCWSTEILEEALVFFPSLKDLFAHRKQSPTSPLLLPGRRAGDQALDLVNTILKSPFTVEQTELFFQYKVREYLLLLLKEASVDPATNLMLTRRELAVLAELKDRLITHPQTKYPIRRLATEAGMNTMRLKMAFKQEYGETIFSFHLNERMKEAHRLIAETDLPTKAIANRVGYELTTSFITRFREFFGYPPSQVKKKR
jgi:AraC-like DNA-binding protein